MEIEYLAIIATWKRSSHSSQSIIGLILLSRENTGRPTRCDNEVARSVKEEFFAARSAMLTIDSEQLQKIRGLNNAMMNVN